MRPGWVALPILVAIPACTPVRQYQEAARRLTFTLDRVRPRMQVAFPLDRSRIVFDVTLGVRNPSTVPFHVHGFQGELRMEHDGGLRPLGQVELLRSLDLEPGGRADLEVSVAFAYQDLLALWPALEAAGRGEGGGSWELQGRLRAEVHGVTVRVPVKVRRTYGEAP